MDNWKIKENRFVAFFDILGFKDMVLHNSHESIFDKLTKLKTHISLIEEIGDEGFKGYDITKDQTKSVTFSDSIIIFSRSDTKADASKILIHSSEVILKAFEAKIPIKGAISYGEISVDFDKSMFFGQPIIDAFLLHEELKQLSVIFDHKSEVKIRSLGVPETLNNLLVPFKAFLSFGRANHTLLGTPKLDDSMDIMTELDGLYNDTSGKPRLYLDNTKEFFQFLKERNS